MQAYLMANRLCQHMQHASESLCTQNCLCLSYTVGLSSMLASACSYDLIMLCRVDHAVCEHNLHKLV